MGRLVTQYGDDRVFRTVGHCPRCGVEHIEQEFKRIPATEDRASTGAPADATHRGRCVRTKEPIYLTL